MEATRAERQNLFQKLTQPHPDITNPISRRQAQVLTWVALGLLITVIVAVIFSLIFAGTATPRGWASLGIAVVAYLLSRLRVTWPGATFLLTSWTALIIGTLVLMDPAADSVGVNVVLMSIALIPLFANLVAPAIVVLMLSIPTALSALLYGVMVPGVRVADYLGAFVVTFLFSSLITILAFVQRGDIKARMAEAEARERTIDDYTRSLQNEVEERTRALETVATVNAQISTILDLDRLLQDVVDLTKERFRLYHAHIYLLDTQAETLRLSSGAGHVGRQMVASEHMIPLEHSTSIVARSAREKHSVRVNDVTKSDSFLPNPMLPATQAEFATPLLARGQVLGVLDVQSESIGHFDQNIASAIELLAAQVAAAISNARLFEAVDRTSRHEQAVSTITRHIQAANDLDDILQTTVRELGKALRVPYTAIELKIAQNGGEPEQVEEAV